jgi:hypothetical protein
MSNPLLVDSGTGLRRPALLQLSHECQVAALKKEWIRPNRVCRLLQDLELAASAYSAHFRQEWPN